MSPPATVDLTPYRENSRLLMEADLEPLQGDRFQPTGFPDLGAATYTRPDGTEMLIVESAQSMANRLEETIWDEAEADLVPTLQGLPYVRVDLPDGGSTSSILEPHRLHSPYIRDGVGEDGEPFLASLKEAFGDMEKEPIDVRRLAETVFEYDPNSVLHGVFFASDELAAGRLSLKRLVSGFIEAENVQPAESGGVKKDPVDPTGGVGGAEEGFGHVPFHRTEYVAENITAYFNLDLSQLEAYGLPEPAEELLLGMALLKIRRFLDGGLRLRTACDLRCTEVEVTRPAGRELPDGEDLEAVVSARIENCSEAGLFRDPPVTELAWQE
jgi:CRISPR-associated protein Csb1